jgi:ribonuclease HII
MLSSRHTEDDKVEAGIDEAGRGCFWGDMYAAAVIWPAEANWTAEVRAVSEQLRDSKKISPKKRERLCDEIMRHAVAYGVGTVSAAEIDDNGMTWANQTAFARALDGLGSKPERILIDGILGLPGGTSDAEIHTIIEGDGQYMCIAAASILAKVSHDRWLQGQVDADPDLDVRYNLRSCKGYGTAKHRAGLEEFGLHPMHRRRFIVKTAAPKCLVKLKRA